ncbi:MAG: prephenate dehydrogenase [Selenomonadaceae bacterium]|nr:prephenate dehydrogenase [Selenomonadaceae bacterium]
MKLYIIGVGLIGGSLGLALKQSLKNEIYITGYGRNKDNLREAKKLGAIDSIALNLEDAADSDIIYLSTPVLKIVPIIKELTPFLSPNTIITDAGSTKGEIFSEIKRILPKNIYYIAGHPMTGREKSGVTAASADLFKDKTYIVIKDEETPQNAYDKLMNILKNIGAKFSYLPIEAHDSAASVISHLPHIAAAGLVHLLKQSENLDTAKYLIGGGFRDTTRIASSDPDMWADILTTNKDAIARDIDKYIDILSDIKSAVTAKDRDKFYSFFDESKKFRDNLLYEMK